MANHCYNYATGTGPKEELERLKAVVDLLKDKENKVDNQVWCWSKIYPLFFTQNVGEVEETEESGEDKTFLDVYENWGSKWFDANFEIDPEGQDITILGDSAWSPVIPFFIALCKEYKLELEGSYEEPGMDFAGEYTINKDGEFGEVQMTYSQYEALNNPEGYWQRLTDDIEEGFYDSFPEILTRLKADNFNVTSEDINQLTKLFDQYKKNE